MVLIFGAIIFSYIYMHYNDCVSSVVGKTFIIGRFYIKILFQGSHLAYRLKCLHLISACLCSVSSPDSWLLANADLGWE